MMAHETLEIFCPMCSSRMDATTGKPYKEFLTIVCSRCARTVIVRVKDDVKPVRPVLAAHWSKFPMTPK